MLLRQWHGDKQVTGLYHAYVKANEDMSHNEARVQW